MKSPISVMDSMKRTIYLLFVLEHIIHIFPPTEESTNALFDDKRVSWTRDISLIIKRHPQEGNRTAPFAKAACTERMFELAREGNSTAKLCINVW